MLPTNWPILLFLLVILLITLLCICLFLRSRKNKPQDSSKNASHEPSQEQNVLSELEQMLVVHKALLDRLLMGSQGLTAVDEVNTRTRQVIEEVTEKSAAAVADISKVLEQDSTKLQQLASTTQAQSQKIIQDSLKKAEQIVSQTEVVRNDVNARMVGVVEGSVAKSNEIIKEAIDAMLADYKQALIAKQQEHINMLQTINLSIEEQVKKRTEDLFVAMKQDIIEASNKKQALMEQELQQVHTELEAYKKQQLEKIESNIYEILARASESVIGQAVNFDLHQELIIKALEQAKREGVFI